MSDRLSAPLSPSQAEPFAAIIAQTSLRSQQPAGSQGNFGATAVGGIVFGQWEALALSSSQKEPAQVQNLQEAYIQPNRVQKPEYRGYVSAPVRSLLSIFQRWQLSDSDAAVLLGVDDAQFIADLRVGTSGLAGKDMKDRVALVIRIYEGVYTLLRDKIAEVRWINSKLPSLDDHSLMELMLRGSFTDLAYVRAFVDYANGR